MLKKHRNRIDEMPTPVTPSFKLKAIVVIDDNAIDGINCVLHDSILLDTRFLSPFRLIFGGWYRVYVVRVRI